jgi:hypothetical protein
MDMRNYYTKPSLNHAHIVMNRWWVQIVLGTGEIYTVARLYENSAQLRLMDYIMRGSKQGQTVFLTAMKHYDPSLEDITNMSEVLRLCGFNSELKRVFFPVCTKEKIRFEPFRDLTEKQVLAVKKQAERYGSKS